MGEEGQGWRLNLAVLGELGANKLQDRDTARAVGDG